MGDRAKKSSYDFVCGDGHRFTLELTRDEFVELVARCPQADCGAPAKRAMLPAGVTCGVVVPGTRAEYPYYNWQIPQQKGQRMGEPNVLSRAHENDIMAGSLKGGQRWERNQL